MRLFPNAINNRITEIMSAPEEQRTDYLMNTTIGLSSEDKDAIITAFLNNQENSLTPSVRARIISLLDSNKTKWEYLADKEENFSEQDKLLIIISLRWRKNWEEIGVVPDESHRKSLALPDNMTIGIELEVER